MGSSTNRENVWFARLTIKLSLLVVGFLVAIEIFHSRAVGGESAPLNDCCNLTLKKKWPIFSNQDASVLTRLNQF